MTSHDVLDADVPLHHQVYPLPSRPPSPTACGSADDFPGEVEFGEAVRRRGGSRAPRAEPFSSARATSIAARPSHARRDAPQAQTGDGRRRHHQNRIAGAGSSRTACSRAAESRRSRRASRTASRRLEAVAVQPPAQHNGQLTQRDAQRAADRAGGSGCRPPTRKLPMTRILRDMGVGFARLVAPRERVARAATRSRATWNHAQRPTLVCTVHPPRCRRCGGAVVRIWVRRDEPARRTRCSATRRTYRRATRCRPDLAH